MPAKGQKPKCSKCGEEGHRADGCEQAQLLKEGKRRCGTCKLVLPTEVFYANGQSGFQRRCKICCRDRQRESRSSSIEAALLDGLEAAKGRAEKKGLPFDLSEADVMQLGEAQGWVDAWDGDEMSSETGTHESTSPSRISIDRLDPPKGYVVGNICLCRWENNELRSDMPAEEFLQLCREVREPRPLESYPCGSILSMKSPSKKARRTKWCDICNKGRQHCRHATQICSVCGFRGHDGNCDTVTKVCDGCGEELLLDQFQQDRKYMSYDNKCKRCGCDRTQARRNSYLDARFKAMLSTAKSSAQACGRECTITVDWIRERLVFQRGLDHYGRIPLSCKTHDPNLISLDRVDSSRGYTPDNVVLTTRRVNSMKKDMPAEEFIDRLVRIADYQDRKVACLAA